MHTEKRNSCIVKSEISRHHFKRIGQ